MGKRVKCPACEQPTYLVESPIESSSASPVVNQDTLATSSAGETSIDQSAPKPIQAVPTQIGKLGRFEIRELLGAGAFGRVYKAYDPQLERFVALKIPTFLSTDQQRVKRFIAEAKHAARLAHPNIVQVFESGQIGGKYYIATQYVDGETLASHIKREPVSVRQAVEWLGQLADAVAYAHQQGIIHRDLKPENVMLDAHLRPLIMDFGLAKRIDDDANMTRDGSLLGTPAYMSPEQARGEVDKLTPASDQYSLGVILYRLLAGTTPFVGPSHVVIANVAISPAPSLADCGKLVPEGLTAICDKVLNHNPSNRYPDCASLKSDLRNWLAGYPISVRPQTSDKRSRNRGGWYRNRKAKLAMGFAGVLFFATIIILFKGNRIEIADDANLSVKIDPNEVVVSDSQIPPDLATIPSPSQEMQNRTMAPTESVSPPHLDSQASSPIHRFATWVIEAGGTVTLEDGHEVFVTSQLPLNLDGLSEVRIVKMQELPIEFQEKLPETGISALIDFSCSPDVTAAVFNTNIRTLKKLTFMGVHSDTHYQKLSPSNLIEEVVVMGVNGPSSLGWSELVKYPNISSLSFYNSSIEKLDFLSQFPRLIKLVLWGSTVTSDDLRPVGTLKELQHLNLGYCQQLSGDFVIHLASLPKLTWLSLYKTSVDDSGLRSIASLTGLQHLSLGSTSISDECLQTVSRLTELRSLAVDNTSISGAVNLNNVAMEHLNLERTQITDQALNQLTTRMPQLKTVLIAGTNVTTDFFDELLKTRPNIGVAAARFPVAAIESSVLPLEQGANNLIDFSNHAESWWLHSPTVKSEVVAMSGGIAFRKYEEGTFAANLEGVPLEEWGRYQLRFQIMSPQEVEVMINMKYRLPGYHGVGLQESLRTEKKFREITLNFTATNVVENMCRLSLSMGNSYGDVYIRDITLTPFSGAGNNLDHNSYPISTVEKESSRAIWIPQGERLPAAFYSHPDGKWLEVTTPSSNSQGTGSKYWFVEEYRTPEYVELHDSERQLYIRLFDSQADLRVGDQAYRRWKTGRWSSNGTFFKSAENPPIAEPSSEDPPSAWTQGKEEKDSSRLTPAGTQTTSGSMGDSQVQIPLNDLQLTPPDALAIASRVFRLGGVVNVIADGKEFKHLNSLDSFAGTAFQITYVGLWHLKHVVDEDLEGLQGLTDLKGIGLDGTGITDQGLMAYDGIRELIRVEIGGTRVTEKGVEELLLSHPEIRDAIVNDLPITDRIMHLVGRCDFVWAHRTQISDAGLAYFSRKEINTLHLDGTRITDEGLKHFSDTTILDLSLANTAISDKGLAYLSKMKQLRVLNLQGTNVTRRGVLNLRKQFPNCRIQVSPNVGSLVD